ncbi:MAG: hypothetical protein ABI859_20850 [Pseudomonadota bacterium]
MRLRLYALLLVALGLLLLVGGSLLLHAGAAETLVGESLAVLVVIVIVTALSLRNSESSLERSRGWLHAGGAYLFVCVLIVAVGLLTGEKVGTLSNVPASDLPAPAIAADESSPASERTTQSPADNASEAQQIGLLLSGHEVRSTALQEKYRNLLSAGYFVRLLAPENLADSAKVRQARFLLARLADSADSYAVEVTAEDKALVEQIQSSGINAQSKARYVQSARQVQLARQQDVDRWMSAKRASISTALGILMLIEQADYEVVAQDDRIAFVDRTAGDRYEILVEQLRSQDARARSALRAVSSHDEQMRAALNPPN